jgi:hypothetical protein
MSERRSGGGWANFAAILFIIAGFGNAIQGLGALFKREYFAENDLLYSNLGFWAVVWVIVGLVQIGAASLLIGRQRGGRTLGIILAAGGAIVQFISIGAYPIWNTILIAMNLLIIYGLTAHPAAYDEGERIAPTLPPDARMEAPPPLG